MSDFRLNFHIPQTNEITSPQTHEFDICALMALLLLLFWFLQLNIGLSVSKMGLHNKVRSCLFTFGKFKDPEKAPVFTFVFTKTLDVKTLCSENAGARNKSLLRGMLKEKIF